MIGFLCIRMRTAIGDNFTGSLGCAAGMDTCSGVWAGETLTLAQEQLSLRTPFEMRTGLVYGTRTSSNHIILSLERMNTIEEVDSIGRTMTCQSGVTLQDIQEKEEEMDMVFGEGVL